MKWDDDSLEVKSEINIAPLVDVILVLLIIFMLASPLLYENIVIDLPKGQSTVVANDLNSSQLILTIDKEGSYFLEDDRVGSNILESKILEELKQRKDKTLFIRADYTRPYGEVAELMSRLKNRINLKIALVTEISKK